MKRRLVVWAIVGSAALILATVIAREFAWTDAFWLWRSKGYFVDYPVPFKATQLLISRSAGGALRQFRRGRSLGAAAALQHCPVTKDDT